MEKVEKLELIKRSLALRHKLKVHETLKTPETHEELAVMLISKWDLEDELKAVDDLLMDSRAENSAAKRKLIEEEWLGKGKKNTLKKTLKKGK